MIIWIYCAFVNNGGVMIKKNVWLWLKIRFWPGKNLCSMKMSLVHPDTWWGWLCRRIAGVSVTWSHIDCKKSPSLSNVEKLRQTRATVTGAHYLSAAYRDSTRYSRQAEVGRNGSTRFNSGRTTPEQTIANRCRNNDKTSVSYGKPLSLHNLWMICHSCHDINSESQFLQGFRLWQKLCSYGILIRMLISWTNLLPKSAKVEYDRFALEQVRLKSAQNFWLST